MNRKKIVFVFLVLSITSYFSNLSALKCRIDSSSSDEEMKKIVRSCVRKIGENYGFNKDYEDYDNCTGEKNDPYRIRNRDQLQMKSGRNRRSMNDQTRPQQNEGGRYSVIMNQRNNNGSKNSTFSNVRYNQDRQIQNDSACIVHCFFEELNMLNNDDFPDKHKVLYILTKDIRDQELREFYTDAIQECFHFLEIEKRKDKCQFSKSLINCMAEYARANCEDWQTGSHFNI